MLAANLPIPPRKTLKTWLYRKRRQLDVSPEDDITLQRLRDLITELITQSDWAAGTDDRALILPVPHGRYVLEGDEVRGQDPRKTKHGIKYAYICPMTSPRMLQHLVHARRVRVKQF